MNIFSNLGITELIIILLLALVVVGPERLPELGRQLGKTLRDVRKAYENLTRDLGPEFTTIQQTTQELRESLDSVRSIPQDMVQSVVKVAELDETIGELKQMAGSVQEVGSTLATAQKVIKDPMQAAVSAAKDTLAPPDATETESSLPEPEEEPVPRTDSEPEADAHG
jgi:Tat protein translocase TatB subunit